MPEFNRTEPYNDLPLLPPSEEVLDDVDIYKQLSKTSSALAELKGRLSVFSNPKILINTLVLQEAKDSSSIENVFTTTDKLYKAFSSSSTNPDPQTKEVLRYRHALWDAWESVQIDGWSVPFMEKIYQVIKDETDGVRNKVVYIGNQLEVVYTPPDKKDTIINRLNNWLHFADSNDGIDPIIKMAVLHYQFEAIHPFKDGNGRIGRILNVVFLSRRNLLDMPVLYLSKFINENKQDYYRLLQEVTEKENWKEWILYMLIAVQETALDTLKKVNGIYDLFSQMSDQVKTQAPNVYSYELIDLLFQQVYCKVGYIVKAGLVTRNTASKYLNTLEKLNFLKKEKVGNELLYQNTALYEYLSNS